MINAYSKFQTTAAYKINKSKKYFQLLLETEMFTLLFIVNHNPCTGVGSILFLILLTVFFCLSISTEFIYKVFREP